MKEEKNVLLSTVMFHVTVF